MATGYPVQTNIHIAICWKINWANRLLSLLMLYSWSTPVVCPFALHPMVNIFDGLDTHTSFFAYSCCWGHKPQVFMLTAPTRLSTQQRRTFGSMKATGSTWSFLHGRDSRIAHKNAILAGRDVLAMSFIKHGCTRVSVRIHPIF